MNDTIYLVRPMYKQWGIASTNPLHFNDLRRAARFARDVPYTNCAPWVEKMWERLQAGLPFIQCDDDDYMFIEFWASEDVALDAAFALAEYCGFELEML